MDCFEMSTANPSATDAPADDAFALTPELLIQVVDRMYLERANAVPVDHVAITAAAHAQLPPPTGLH